MSADDDELGTDPLDRSSSFLATVTRTNPDTGQVTLTRPSVSGEEYKIDYSPDLLTPFATHTTATAIRLLSPGRLAYDGPVDSFLLKLLVHCKEGATPGSLPTPPAGAAPLSAAEFHARVATLCRELIRHGILQALD